MTIRLKRNEALKSLNSVIQCLFHIEPFVNYIKSKFYEINKRDIYNKFKASGKCLTDPLKNLLDELFPEKFEKTEDYEMKTKSESISTEDLSKMIYIIKPKYNEKQDDLIKKTLEPALGDEIINFSSVTKIGKERIYEIIENIIAKTA